MKKRILATVCMAVAGLLAFSACSFSDLIEKPYDADDTFPYDVAEERGTAGSPESWLASQETPSTELRRLYEEARADGSFAGTYYEFLQGMDFSEDNGAYVQNALRSSVTVYALFHNGTRGDFYALGSGIVYSLNTQEGDALVVTNYHVVYNASSNGKETIDHISDSITLFLYGSLPDNEDAAASSAAIPATFLGGAMEYDIAVLKVDDSPILTETEQNNVYAKEVVACNSDSVTAGERVYAIGNANGQGVISVTEGVVSVESEQVQFRSADEKSYITLPEIRIDAAVNHGNSGGGLFNGSGELLGIVNGRMEADGVVGFGYAIPANVALAVAQNVIDTCAVSAAAHGGAQARLGITVQRTDSRGIFDERTGKYYTEEKIVVSEVQSGYAGARAGMQAGDTLISAKITSRGGEVYITKMLKLTVLLLEVRSGDAVEFTLSRENQAYTVTVIFGAEDFRLID